MKVSEVLKNEKNLLSNVVEVEGSQCICIRKEL